MAREHLALLFEGAVAIDEEAVVCTYPERGALFGERGHVAFAEFLFESLPALAVKAEKALRRSDPELFGEVFVEDGRDGILDDQVPGHLDFDDVRFVVRVFHVIESFHDSGVFVEAAFRADIRAYGVLDFGIALQGDGVVVHPLFAVELENALRGTCPEFTLVEESVLGA